MIDTTLIRNGYDRIATRYADRRDQTSSLPFLEALDARLGANNRILDLGCGAGLPVDRWLVDRGHSVIGLDISAEMVRRARRNVPEARYEQHDMAALEPRAYAVDAVVSFFALFHVDRCRHRQFLGCLHACLPRGGLLLITTGRSDWEGEEDFLGQRLAWSHFDRATNRALIEDAGFAVLLEDRHRGNASEEDDWHPIFLARAD